MNNLKEKVLILGLLLLAIYVRIHYMDRGFFYDELYTIVHCIQAPTLYDALYKDFTTSNHLGYTFIAYPICHLFGTSEWTLRFPALIFGLGSILLFWYWSRKYFGQAVAILGSLFLALAPAHIIWSASGRGYSACIFFTILSTHLYFSLLKQPSLKTSLILALSNILGFCFNLYFLCVFTAECFHFIFTCIMPRVKNKSLILIPLSLGATILGTLITYSPLLTILKGMAREPGSFMPDFPVILLKDLLSLPLWPLGIICLILLLIGYSRPNKELPDWPIYTAILFLMIVPIWLSKPAYLYPRFFAYLLPFIFLLIANGIIRILEKLPQRAKPYLGAIIALVLGLICWTWLSRSSKIVEDFCYKFRESVKFAESVASPQTRFCAFGPENGFFQVYSHRPVTTFNTFEDFIKFCREENEIIGFYIMGPPMPDEDKKMILFTIQFIKPKVVIFDNVIVSDLKS